MLCAIAHLDRAPQDLYGTSTASCTWAPGRREFAQRQQPGRAASGHADYFFAAQDEFQKDVDLDGDGGIEHTDGGYSEKALLDLCIREAPDALAYNDDRCRTSGLLAAHVRAINNYY